jgi:hypothetical protein
MFVAEMECRGMVCNIHTYIVEIVIILRGGL